MAAARLSPPSKQEMTQASEILDVVIVGAGISGINTAYRLQKEIPGTRYAVLEARDALGGTWDFFKYPGLRSDSDLFTFGFSWRPWLKQNPIADAGSILEYLRSSAASEGISKHIRFGHSVEAANWSSKSQTWELTVAAKGGREKVTTRFLVLGTGYYDYKEPLSTVIPNLSSFSGKVVHTQFWPEGLDYTGKKIVVVGSGATAITLVPVLAQKAASVTMLQRSPSYILSLNNSTADSWTHRYLPRRLAYQASRLHFLILPMVLYYVAKLFPTFFRNVIRKGAVQQLPKDYPVERDFKPRYNPFDQRVCFAPDGDFYTAIREGRARVVTDTVKTVQGGSIVLDSGAALDADIIVTATGLKLQFGGRISLSVDGTPHSLAGKFAWHNAMLQDLPNTVFVMGYTMAAWTLGADTTAFLLCRLLKGMRKYRLTSIVPRVPQGKPLEPRPLLDLNSTYVLAAAKDIPRTGDKGPWRRRMNYFTDIIAVKYGNVTQGLDVYQGDIPVGGVTL